MENEDDGIGNLPEVIIHHIISFLGTKEAARTSILSKSWTYRWTYSRNIQLFEEEFAPISMYKRKRDSSDDDNKERKEARFLNFVIAVYQVLLKTQNAKLRSFNIKLSWNKSKESYVNDWIRNIITRVEEIRIVNTNPYKKMKIPFERYDCRSIKLLELSNFDSRSISTCDSFESLRKLVSTSMMDSFTCRISTFVANCSSLEELSVKGCGINNGVLEVRSSGLKSLVANDLASQIEISAPNLECLHLAINHNITYLLQDIPEISFAKIYSSSSRRYTEESIEHILSKLHTVKELSLDNYILWAMSDMLNDGNLLDVTFNNLRGLTLNCNGKFDIDESLQLYAINHVLQSAMLLESIRVHCCGGKLGDTSCCIEEKESCWKDQNLFEHVSLDNLKKISLVCGCRHSFVLLPSLLKQARQLQVLEYNLDGVAAEKLGEKIFHLANDLCKLSKSSSQLRIELRWKGLCIKIS